MTKYTSKGFASTDRLDDPDVHGPNLNLGLFGPVDRLTNSTAISECEDEDDDETGEEDEFVRVAEPTFA